MLGRVHRARKHILYTCTEHTNGVDHHGVGGEPDIFLRESAPAKENGDDLIAVEDCSHAAGNAQKTDKFQTGADQFLKAAGIMLRAETGGLREDHHAHSGGDQPHLGDGHFAGVGLNGDAAAVQQRRHDAVHHGVDLRRAGHQHERQRGKEDLLDFGIFAGEPAQAQRDPTASSRGHIRKK